jgi:hypothetical protein
MTIPFGLSGESDRNSPVRLAGHNGMGAPPDAEEKNVLIRRGIR